MATKKAKRGIIIFQLTKNGYLRTSMHLNGSGFVQGTDYTFTNDCVTAGRLVEENTPQMLVTGVLSQGGGEFEVMEWIKKLRIKNPQLVVVTFSSCAFFDTDKLLDGKISKYAKDQGQKELVTALTDFRDGKLRRAMILEAEQQARPKVWAQEEILKMWPQAAGELQGFRKYLARTAGITADQLSMALQLAEEGFKIHACKPARDDKPL